MNALATPLVLALLFAGVPAATELLDRSVAYHDPNGAWATQEIVLTTEVRLNDRLAAERGYASRRDRIAIDVARGGFGYLSRRNEDTIVVEGTGDDFRATLNGSSEISDADRERMGLAAERLPRLRDYFTYVFGLPMKLRDPGTRVHPEVTPTDFAGRQTLAVRVTYDPEVGGDIWYFYFDPKTAALVGSRFFHDEAANDGEHIVYEGEVRGPHGLRLPRLHHWHMNEDGERIAVDEVLSVE